MNVNFSNSFLDRYHSLDSRIKRSFEKKIILFIHNPYHSSLHNHQLSGKMSRYRSIRIVGDWCAFYRTIGSQRVVFEAIGKKKDFVKI